MRLLCFLILSLCFALQADAQVNPGKIYLDYACKKKPLSRVLNELSKKSGVSIIFQDQKIPRKRKISISAYNESLSDILTVILSKTNVEYDIVDNHIILRRMSRGVNDQYSLHGYITDLITGEPLINALVYDIETYDGGSTNESGFYSLTLKTGYHELVFSYLGYARDTLLVNFDKDRVMNMKLKNISQLNEIVIVDQRDALEYNSSRDFHHMSKDQMTSSVNLGGETDVMRYAQFMPGVSSGADGFGGLNVRGGSEDQNLILYDGVPVYNIDHAFGLLSVFNSDMLANAEMHKGSIPAAFGGRLSSVVDIATRTGKRNKLGGNISLSTIAAKGTLEGPLGRSGSSFIVSGRRTYIDPWIKIASEFQNQSLDRTGSTAFNFYDLNGKLNWVINDRNSIIFNVYRGRDAFNNEYATNENEVSNLREYSILDWNWSNQIQSVTWKNQVSDKVFSNVLVYQSSYEANSYDHSKLYRTTDVNAAAFDASLFRSSIVDKGGKWHLSIQPNPKHHITLGGEAVLHRFDPSLVTLADFKDDLPSEEIITREELQERINSPRIYSSEFTGFLSDKYKSSKAFEVEYGLRINMNIIDETTYLAIQPRISMKATSGNLYFKSGLSHMVQNLHRLQSAGLGFPTAVWLPNTERIRPEQSWLGNATLGYDIAGIFQVKVSGYYKYMIDATSFNEGGLLPISRETNWQFFIPRGNGDAYGMECSFDKIAGKTTWRANYSLGVSERTFDDINNGNTFPFRYDRRHQIKFAGTHRLNENAEFMANFIYASGNPITEPTQIFENDETGRLLFLYEAKNNNRLPAYQRVDVGFNFYSDLKFGKQKISIGVYNLFNEQNFLFSDLVRDDENPESYKLFRYTIIPVFPSVSYSLVW